VQLDAREVLADVATLGPFFAVATGPPDVDGRRPLSDLWTDPEPLCARIAHVREVLGTDDRVAASITFQGLAARVLSAPFAAAALHGVVPRLTPDVLCVRVCEESPWPLWCAEPAVHTVTDPREAASTLALLLLDDLLAPLVTAVRRRVRLPARLLWGNVASSVAAAKRLVGEQRPAAAERAAAIAEHLLATGPLAGAGTLRAPEPPDRAWTFRRRSCCLFYRVCGAGLCGDCALDAVPDAVPDARE
jgi:ferric iron reductase protein FhuF